MNPINVRNQSMYRQQQWSNDEMSPNCQKFLIKSLLYIEVIMVEKQLEKLDSFVRDAHVVPKLLSCEEYCRRDTWLAHRRLIAVYLRC
jgi:hypothetical protein